MNISANGKMLATVTKDLSRRWEETKHHWQDAKSREFEQRFLAELFAVVDRAVPVFDDLEKVVSKVRTDCE